MPIDNLQQKINCQMNNYFKFFLKNNNTSGEDVLNCYDLIAALLNKIRQLTTFLGQVANCVSRDHYTIITRHVTSRQ